VPKVKTRKSITKRFRVTRTGKVLRGQAFRRHLNVKKSAKRKRRLNRVVNTKKVYAKKILKALGK